MLSFLGKSSHRLQRQHMRSMHLWVALKRGTQSESIAGSMRSEAEIIDEGTCCFPFERMASLAKQNTVPPYDRKNNYHSMSQNCFRHFHIIFWFQNVRNPNWNNIWKSSSGLSACFVIRSQRPLQNQVGNSCPYLILQSWIQTTKSLYFLSIRTSGSNLRLFGQL